ncbi:hypothetical protein EVAR_28071_1 [Eumeta japonica]|uniref:Uncharacterized protein n=1 Tax=Eumeta variegata TaxID=151549 RepID=A0A4C1W6F4_EUMVA|nr:hypothetical protein EVAR_28071_1 [Eumeta japonica]
MSRRPAAGSHRRPRESNPMQPGYITDAEITVLYRTSVGDASMQNVAQHSLHPGGCDCLHFPGDMQIWHETSIHRLSDEKTQEMKTSPDIAEARGRAPAPAAPG